jgi:hypothetical protein
LAGGHTLTQAPTVEHLLVNASRHYEEQEPYSNGPTGQDEIVNMKLLEGRAGAAQRVTMLLVALENYRGQLRAAPY